MLRVNGFGDIIIDDQNTGKRLRTMFSDVRESMHVHHDRTFSPSTRGNTHTECTEYKVPETGAFSPAARAFFLKKFAEMRGQLRQHR